MAQESKNKQGSRKQITFDLSQKALETYYPKPKATLNPKFYKKAYTDISKFLKKNGFEHRQFSVYISIHKMTMTDVTITMQLLADEMPWLIQCVNQIDVTNIGTQHSLIQTLSDAAQDFDMGPIKK
jgi:virulence-associated protein VapD